MNGNECFRCLTIKSSEGSKIHFNLKHMADIFLETKKAPQRNKTKDPEGHVLH